MMDINHTPKEIAEKLYELNCDMDFRDYEDTKENDINNLTKAISYINNYANNNCSPACWESLYKTLEGLCD